MDMWRSCIIILSKKKLPEVIDLFSGCGGLALGFQRAGFEITHGIELMGNAVWNSNYNLSIKFGHKLSHICGDITKIDEKEFADAIGKNGCIVIGGPPCQAYSLVGRAKLNSLRKKGTFVNDKRGYLFEDFLRFALGLKAKAIVMENVPQCVAYGKLNIPESVSKILEENGYTAYWTILNAADFGVPQIRERMILFAVKGKIKPVLPLPTHSGKMFEDFYPGNRFKDFNKFEHFLNPLQKKRKKPRWITTEEAIGDLPILHINPNDVYNLNGMNQLMSYSTEPQNIYQELMRNEDGTVTGNVYRNTPRDYPIFARMKEGDNYVRAAEIAEEILEERVKNEGVKYGTVAYERLKKDTVPPYSIDKFLSKWKKIERNKPVYTLVAHLSVDTYSHIHPWEPRGISVREAARLQSFPDSFVFHSNMGEAFKQIGNSVPPLLAEGIACAVRKALSQLEE